MAGIGLVFVVLPKPEKFLVSLVVVFALIIILVSLWLYRKHRQDKIRTLLLAKGATSPVQLTPEEYERFCSALLENNGWKIQITQKTGDYGADIIALKKIKDWLFSANNGRSLRVLARCSKHTRR